MAIKIEDLRAAAKRTPTNEDAGYYTQDPVNEASAPPHPVDWDKGFQHPYRVAGGGSERPYLKDGRWKLRLFNVKDRKNYIYDYGTDLMDCED